jgi:UDP-N-acetyl-D-glucosamine dehydrogenase
MNAFSSTLLKKIKSKNATIAIAGMGYVGMPLAGALAKAGFKKIIGIDIDQKRVDQLNSGISLIPALPKSSLNKMIKNGFYATTDFLNLQVADALIICVPTPLTDSKEPDLTYIQSTLTLSIPHLKPGVLISLESTTYPGTTEELVAPQLVSGGFSIGVDIFLGYAPEREDPGNEVFQTQDIPRVLGGMTPICLRLMSALYGSFISTIHPVSSPRAAELTKLLENIQRSVNIGLMNEMKIIADKMGLNIFEVIDAASTKPFGFTPYYPGPGIGGHCIPIDPFYLTWKAKMYGVHTRFIELAGEINESMVDYVVSKSILKLNEQGIAISKSKILILGLSYKKDVGDLRESPNIKILNSLINLGAKVNYSDPFFKTIPSMRKFKLHLSSMSLTPGNLKKHDLVLILTDHSSFDLKLICKHSVSIIDTRGSIPLSEKVTYA